MNCRAIFKTVVLVAVVTLGGYGALAQETGSLLKFISPEAFAAFVAYPSAAASLPEMELIPREIISAMGIKEIGVDPLEIEEAIVFVEPPQAASVGDYCVLLRLKKSVDEKAISSGALIREGIESGALAAASFEGKKGFKAKYPQNPSIVVYDSRTIFFGPEAMLLKVFKPVTTVSPLAAKLRSLPATRHASLIVLVPPVRELLVEQISNTPPLPPPLAALKNLPELVDQLEIHAKAGSEGSVKIALVGKDKTSAEEARSIVTAAMDFGRETILAQTGRFDSEDPVEKATRNYAQRMTDYFQKMLKPQLNDKVVSVEIKGDGNSQLAAIGIGASLLLPAVQSAREAARRMNSSNNLKQIALAFHNYESANRRLPPQSNVDDDDKPLLSWRVHILPFIEHQELYEQFHLDEPWDSDHNIKLLDKMPKIYRSPNSKHTNKTTYLIPLGKGTPFAEGTDARLADMLDGTSNTILALEANDDRAVPWTKPTDYEIDAEKPMTGLLGLRPGGFLVVFGDGHVRFISETVEASVMRAMFTASGAEAYQLP